MNEKEPQTVRQLITMVQAKLPGTTEEKILESILALQGMGKIKFGNQNLQFLTSFAAYLKTSQVLWYWTTIAILVVTAAIIFAIPEDFPPFSLIRNVLGVLFVLWLPGYTSMRALFPSGVPIKASTENLETIERIVLSIGMSLAIVPIVGFILNYTPWGIRLTPIVLSLMTLTIIFATFAVRREYSAKVKSQNSTQR
jgi:uncharacterized membrane protein